MFRESQNWLRYRVDQTISRQHGEILKNIKRYKTSSRLDYLISIERWYLTVLITLLVFVLGTLFFHFAGISDKKLDSVIDQRSSNLATIGGMSLAVIGFLMSNIAVKENYAYKVVFRKTRFYVVVLCILTALACFVLIGTFRYVIKSSEWYNDLILSSVFVFVGILVLIGFLFFSAVNFTNPVKIDDLVFETLLLNASTVIYEGLIRQYSLEGYQQLMRQRGIKLYNIEEHLDDDWLNTSSTILSAEEVRRMEARESYIADIDMIGLATYFDTHKADSLYYHDLFIGLKTANNGRYILVPGKENTPADKRALKKLLYFSSGTTTIIPAGDLREHYDTRLVDYSESGKDKELERLLKGLTGLFTLQMKYQHTGQFDLIQGLSPVLTDAVRAAIRKKNLASFRHLIVFCTANCYKAIDNLDITVFNTMLGYYSTVFNELKSRMDEGGYRDFLPYGLDPVGYYEVFLYKIAEQKRADPTILSKINAFGSSAYSAFGWILYSMLSLKDYKNLKKGVTLLNKPLGDEPDYRTRVAYMQALRKPPEERDLKEISSLRQHFLAGKTLQTYKRQTVFGIKAWIIHLCRYDKINFEDAVVLIKETSIHYSEIEDVLDDILFFRQGLMFKHFTWQSWVFPDYFDSDEFTISNPTTWLTFGFMAEQINRYQLPMFDTGLQLQNAGDLTFLINDLKDAKQYFIDHLPRWQAILRVNDKSDLERKADAVITFFVRLEGNQMQSELARIAEATLKQPALKEFELKVTEAWKRESGIYQLFERLKKIESVAKLDVPLLGFDRYMADLKPFFVNYKKPDDIRLLATLGAQAARAIDEAFFDAIISDQPSEGSGDLLTLVESGLTTLRSRGKNPDCIFISATRLYLEENFLTDARYVEKVYEENSTALPFLKGWFDDVPVYSSFADILVGKVVVAEFRMAFQLLLVKDTTWPENVLQIAVSQLSRLEADALASARSAIQPPPEIKVLKAQNGVHLKLGVSAKFGVEHPDALIVANLENIKP